VRLTIFGSSIVSAYWNGAATYYRGVLGALARYGHEIVFCEPDAFDRQSHRDLQAGPDYARVEVYSTEAERDGLLTAALADSDWVIKCSGVGVWDAELEHGLAAGGPACTAFWDVDAPATLAGMRSADGGPLRALLPRLDHVFTYGGGPPVVRAYRALGARACAPIYNGLDPAVHHPVPAEPRWDVLFMGNRLPDREERVEEFLLGPARALPSRRFALGGSGWERKHVPRNVTRLGHVPTDAHNRLNASARLVLNVHRTAMVENGWSPATRMFEAAGVGAGQITDEWEGIEDFFEPGVEILVARDGSDVERAVRRVSASEAGRIGLAARRRALRDHTYASRARRLHGALGGGTGREAATARALRRDEPAPAAEARP
jgi:spore maturation protein CgeB